MAAYGRKLPRKRGCPALLEAKQCLHVGHVDAVNEAEVGKVAFLLLGLLCENMTFESMFSLDLS